MKWISIKDKLPHQMKGFNYSHHVLGFDGNTILVCYHLSEIDEYDKTAWVLAHGFGKDSSIIYLKITHWMPLPELPNN